jgi:lysozyme family protein
MPTFEETQAGYRNLWAKCTVRPEHEAAAEALARKAIANQVRYSGGAVPWFVKACLHYREADFDFSTYLGNGQPLDRVTTEVPAGRGPFSSWEAGAADALSDLQSITAWPIERCLYEMERFNGFGYFNRNANSPYLWSWTILYTSGKYVDDHDYKASAVDAQCGCAAILKALEKLGAVTFEATMPTQPPPGPAPTVTVTHPTTGQKFVMPVIDLAQIESMLQNAANVLPFLSAVPGIGPFAQEAMVVIPIVEGGLQMADKIKAGGHIPSIISQELRTIADQIDAKFPKP